MRKLLAILFLTFVCWNYIHAGPVYFQSSSVVERYKLELTKLGLGGVEQYNFSGCCLVPSRDELFIAINSPECVQVYDLDGNYKKKISFLNFSDTEAICARDLASNKFAVVEERIGRLVVVTIASNTLSVNRLSSETLDLGLGYLGNDGLEGISWDSARNRFYVAEEFDPMRIYSVSGTVGDVTTSTQIDADTAFAGVCSDLSDLYYDEYSDHLFVLSDESNCVIECELDGTIIGVLPVKGGQPEGLAISADAEKMYIISEPNDMYRYNLAPPSGNGCESVTTLVEVAISSQCLSTVTVEFVVSSESAVFGDDYTYSPTNGIITFAPGSTSEFITLNILADPFVEGDELLVVTLTNAANAELERDILFEYTITGDPCELVVVSARGMGDPPVGTHIVSYESVNTCTMQSFVSAGAGAGYACTGWTGTVSVPVSGVGTNTGPFSITNNSTVTWQWEYRTVDISFSNSVVTENSGLLTNWGKVTVQAPVPSDLTIFLTSSDTTEVAVASSVVITEGSQSASFDMLFRDDKWHDGPQYVSIQARATDYPTGSAWIEVLDTGSKNIMLVSTGSVWTYRDNGSDQGTAWRDPGFDTSGWSNGTAQLGYGDGDEATVVSYGPNPLNKYITTYFRREFQGQVSWEIGQLRAKLLRDDGGVVYINGYEMMRPNMPIGTINYLTTAIYGVEDTWTGGLLAGSGLVVDGTNVAAVEMHQDSVMSSDISFDLAMDGATYPRAGYTQDRMVEGFVLSGTHTDLDGPVSTNWSGCCLVPGRDEIMVTISDPPAIQVYDTGGTYKTNISLSGFSNVSDICLYDIAGERFCILEENSNTIVIVSITNGTTSVDKYADGRILETGLVFGDPTKGLNGIAYDSLNEWFYVVKESDPIAVYRVIDLGASIWVGELFDADTMLGGLCQDLSDIYYDSYSARLFLLSGGSNAVIECDLMGGNVSYVFVTGTDPQGLSLSDDLTAMHIVGAENDHYVYELRKMCTDVRAGTNMTFEVNLSSPWPQTVTVDFSVTSITAVAGVDYSPATGTVTFAAGSVSETFVINIETNTEGEALEVIEISLTNAVKAWLGGSTVCEITILADRVALNVDSVHGFCDPDVGVNSNDCDSVVVCAVTNSPFLSGPGVQWECYGWIGTVDIPSNGFSTNTGPVLLQRDSSITWLWTTNYYLDTGTNGNGSVDVPDNWYRVGSNVVITAIPGDYFVFKQWVGSTGDCSIADNEITVPMTVARSIVAHFAASMATNDVPEWWLAMYYPGTNDFDSSAMTDTDSDGMFAWQEYEAGTDPTNAFSVFKINYLMNNVDEYIVKWLSVTGKTYSIYKSTNLLAPWPGIAVTSGIAGDSSGTNAYIDDGINSKVYYRIKVE